jgi:hypothetical protein
LDDQIKENEMGGACGALGGGGDRNPYRVLVGNAKEKEHLENLRIDGRKLDLKETGWG